MEPTRDDLLAVAALLPALEEIASRPVEWRGGEKLADGSIQMPYPEYAPAAQRVLSAIYKHHLVIDGFDWSKWDWRAHGFDRDEVVRTATLLDVRRLLTVHARAERFSEGHFADMIARGHIAALLRRLAELAADHR